MALLALCVPMLAAQAADNDVHWAFRRLAAPSIPAVQDSSRPRTPIDAFVLAKLEADGLSMSGDAEPNTLIRRTYLDLLGLPPSPAEVQAFLDDTAPAAYERLIDRLLASAHFGERWGRHWLDAVGFTDTVGFDVDANNFILPKGKWRYRHYVVDAFNSDKPYREFVRQQIAGDEMVDWRNAETFTDEIREHLIATGFLRTAQDFTHEPESTIESNMYAVLHDTIEITGTSLLGLTLQCARCHDHKFDPIGQRDYYQLMACLIPAYNPQDWKPVYPWKPEISDRGLPDIAPKQLAEVQSHNQRIDESIEPLKREIAEVRGRRKDLLAQAQSGNGGQTNVSDQDVENALTDDERRQIREKQDTIAALEKQKQSWGTIQALYDVGTPPVTRILQRGSFQTPGDSVQPGFISVMSDPDSARYFAAAGDTTSGRRTALADWLTDANLPSAALLSRVMVNRVWQHLFGQGLVSTSENFGIGGEPPSHPELLEWLSRELIAHDWSVKWLIHEIMLSTVYRQASTRAGSTAAAGDDSRDPYEVDPENALLWRQRLRRLDAEVIRDSLLAASGDLNRELGGPPIRTLARPDGLVVVDPDALPAASQRYRRSIYLMYRRAYNLSLLSTFDQPFIATTCARRSPAAVVSQSLTMMNDEFLFEQAEHVAERVARIAGSDAAGQIDTVFRLLLIREPNGMERERCAELLARQAQLFRKAGHADEEAARLAVCQLCHAVFNTNEFLYAE